MKKSVVLLFMLMLCLGLWGHGLAEAIEEPVQVRAAATDAASVRKAQKRLIALGILKDKADGVAGPKTEKALRTFQRKRGLSETGVLDADTWDALQNGDEDVSNEAVETVAVVTADTATLRQTQQRLIDLGYLRGSADGVWGSQSKAAMRLFQQFHGLTATGSPDGDSAQRLFSTAAQALPGALRSGDSGMEVTQLQRRLSQLGFLDDEMDGVYGKGTVEAVRAFQQHLIDQGVNAKFEIQPTGEATPMTRYILLSDSYSTYLRDVAAGENSEEARRVERRLIYLGYMDMPADGAMDSYALEALELFKARAGILTFGAADRATIDALFAATAPRAAHPAWHDIASGDKGLTVQAAQEALVYGGMLAALPEGKYDKNMEKAVERLHTHLASQKREETALFENAAALSRQAVEALVGGLLDYASDVGAEGKKNSEAETLRVQRRLYALYYLPKIGVDGKFGRQTRDAIKLFQETNGIEATGVADRSTQEVLFSADAREKRFKHKIEVRLDEQRVYVYALNSGGDYEQVQSFICSLISLALPSK